MEECNIDNSGQKVNVVWTNFMDSYISDNIHSAKATNLAAYTEERDINMIQSTLECSQALRKCKPHPKQRLQRERHLELEIKQPLFAELSPELQTSWRCKQPHLKEKVIGQWLNCLPTKNH